MEFRGSLGYILLLLYFIVRSMKDNRKPIKAGPRNSDPSET